MVIPLGPALPPASCDLPGNVRTGRPYSLLDLAPGGVYRAFRVATEAVGSYPAVSPLPKQAAGACLGGLFSVALSTGRPVSVLRTTLPCGVRTFLRRHGRAVRRRPFGKLPSRLLHDESELGRCQGSSPAVKGWRLLRVCLDRSLAMTRPWVIATPVIARQHSEQSRSNLHPFTARDASPDPGFLRSQRSRRRRSNLRVSGRV